MASKYGQEFKIICPAFGKRGNYPGIAVERSGCSSAEPYPLACEGLFCDSEVTRQASLLRKQIVDREVLSHETYAEVESAGGLLRCEPLEAAVAGAIVLPEIAVHRFETMVRLETRGSRTERIA